MTRNFPNASVGLLLTLVLSAGVLTGFEQNAVAADSSKPVDFSTYPAKAALEACKPLNYLSYSRARNAEDMIKKNNPEVSKPNFGGKYLLVQIPYMMGTDWLIADCETGSFLKETLTGSAQFKVDSFLIKLSQKDASEWKLWTGTTFIKAEEKDSKRGTQENTLEARYQDTFESFATPLEQTPCAKLNFASYFRAQTSELNIRNQKLDLTRPNFAGNHLLIRVELLFETLWLIADCKTGNFASDYLSGDLLFKPSSSLVVKTDSGKAPELMTWDGSEWIRRPDPTRTDGGVLQNSIHGDLARALIRILPNPDHHSKIAFQDFQCTALPEPQCSFLDDAQKTPSARTVLKQAPESSLLKMLKARARIRASTEAGTYDFRIDEGHCVPEKSLCILGIK